MSSSVVDLKKFQISLDAIKKATNDFHPDSKIGDGGFAVVYKGRISDRWQNRWPAAIKRHIQNNDRRKKQFYNELELISKLEHKNIIPFIGYCDEEGEMIFVFRYATFGSLDYHLEDDNKRRCLTWEERLNICLGAARGLDYLHQSRIIHRDVKSGNILIADGMEAKVGDFGLSKSGFNNRLPSQVHTNVAGTNVYLDPLYNESSILTKESDVYSFGVVLFEMVSGVLAYRAKDIGDGQPRPLLNLVRRFCENGVEKLIDPHIRDQLQEVPYLDPQIEDNIEISSFYTFIDIAYMCISLDIKKRPTMKEIIKRLKKALDNQMNSPLIKCVMGDTRFSYGKPVMAFTIYNDLVHFHSFGHDLFDRLIQILYVAVKTKHTIEYMVYLSANVLVLNFLNNLDYRSKLKWYNGAGLMEYVVKLYGIISDRLKNEVGSLLDLHILAIMASKDSDDLSTWLTDHLNQLEENFVPHSVILEIFTRLFEYINVRLFNSMLLKPDCLTFSRYLNMRYTTFTLEEWWESHATSFGAFEDAVRYSPILEHTSAFIELYHLVVHRLGIWSEYEYPSKFRCLTQKHLDKLFDIYEEECDLSQEARNEHMSSLQEFIREDDSNLLDDTETYLLESGPSEPFDEIDIILKSKVKESALINPSSVFASYPAFRFIL